MRHFLINSALSLAIGCMGLPLLGVPLRHRTSNLASVGMARD